FGNATVTLSNVRGVFLPVGDMVPVDSHKGLHVHSEGVRNFPRADSGAQQMGCSAVSENMRYNISRKASVPPDTVPRGNRTVNLCPSKVDDRTSSTIKLVPSFKVRKYAISQSDRRCSFFGLEGIAF